MSLFTHPASDKVRHRLSQYDSFEHAVHLIKTSSNIIVLTGAGISTSLGIPDFRSKETGFFLDLQEQGYTDPEDLFHIDNFRHNPTSFFNVVYKIVPKPDSEGGINSKVSPTHAFIKLLEDKGKLLTNYTQNIDGLEFSALISESKVVQCHGSFATATCQTCGKKKPAKKYLPVVRQKSIPWCPCSRNTSRDTTPSPGTRRKPANKKSKKIKKRKRREEYESDSDEEEETEHRADQFVLKPDIVFYGEKVIDNVSNRFEEDREKVDLVLIIGTSLKVSPINRIPAQISPNVPQIFISKVCCSEAHPDIELLGQCDVIVAELARRAGWSLKHEKNEVVDGNVKIETVLGSDRQHLVTLRKANTTIGAAQIANEVLPKVASAVTGVLSSLMVGPIRNPGREVVGSDENDTNENAVETTKG